MEVFGALLIVLAGVVLAVLGGGGSIMAVPILVYLFDKSAAAATTYSLFLVGLAASLATVKYAQNQQISYKIAGFFALPSLLGMFIVRRFVLPAIPAKPQLYALEVTKDQLILFVFAIIMILASASMIFKKTASQQDASSTPHLTLIAVYGLFIGSLTGFIGAGGGFLIVPALVFFAKLDMKKAVGSSLLIIGCSSLFGFLSSLGTMPIDWSFMFLLAVLSLFGIKVGGRLAPKFSSEKLKPLFGYFTFLMGLLILSQQILF